MGRLWAINGRFLSQPMTGVQRYAREVVRALDKLVAAGTATATDLDVELLAPPGATVPFPLTAVRHRTVGRLSGHAWEQIDLPRHVPGGLLSLCNTGPIAVRKQIVCIHDANTFNCPESYSLGFRALYRTLLPALGHTAEAVATVSNYSADQLVWHGICRAGAIIQAPNGHEHVLGWEPRHSPVTRAAAGRSTIVVLASWAPHKNTDLIVRMADRLAEFGLGLAMVGASDPRVFSAHAGVEDAPNVAWLGRITDGEIAALLKDSLCLAMPSREEGFGLPPLEAMALGCPVVVSDRASLPEVCGGAALYASPDDPEPWLDAFLRLRDSPALRASLVERGRIRAARYRWEACAAQYLRAMDIADVVSRSDRRAQAAA
ncbi:glycosyltransferase family 4 protein [Chthonobacter rhizosphaerae]|uniref:glycosyltransferase family 4 protein n=1 Tax=Chthonobacter rhizosphaerae TaxID=2735553 RepID=UPI0015EEBDB5|nr:glycosyltransferase family 1 protein [Chthonobacter rhizosphaerae]